MNEHCDGELFISHTYQGGKKKRGPVWLQEKGLSKIEKREKRGFENSTESTGESLQGTR